MLCMWCGAEITGEPCYFRKTAETWYTGVHCDLSCAKANMLSMGIPAIISLFGQDYPNVYAAPDRSLLDVFGGPVNRETFNAWKTVRTSSLPSYVRPAGERIFEPPPAVTVLSNDDEHQVMDAESDVDEEPQVADDD